MSDRQLTRFRLLTGPWRLQPDFIIIGAQRGGTTSLYEYLTGHPCVVPAVKKEVHFFDIHFTEGLRWYQAHFPLGLHKVYAEGVRQHRFVTGEASPYYICHPHAPRRIARYLPRAKLIALLRHPVDRACSQYYWQVRQGFETLSFEEGIEKEEERIRGERLKMLADENYASFNDQHFSYLSRGLYADQLQAWLRLFPREQMLILKSEDLFDDPTATLKRVAQFLNLPAWEPREYRRYNVGDYPEMAASTRQRLMEYFRPHNQRLYDLVGLTFD